MRLAVYILFISLLTSCGIYSFRGGQYSGAKTFSVDFFKSQSALAPQVYSQNFTESLKDLLLAQSPLSLVTRDGELQYEGAVTGYTIAPVAIQENETASLNRLTITVKVKYTNTLDNSLSFERNFSKFADFAADVDLFTVEETLWQQINDQLTQEIYNASVGNW
ncbi:MAG: hypothetical protein RL220_713 [Bacteroidota bacterium]